MDIDMQTAAADHRVSIRGSRSTALIILSLWSRAEEQLLFFHRRVFWKTSAGVTAQQRWSRSHGREKRSSSCWQPCRECAVASSPACFSTKRATRWSRLFKDVLSPVRFWMWSLSGAQDGHDCCLTCLGIQHTEEVFVDGSCSSSGDMTISEFHIDSAMSNMAGCLCSDLAFVPALGAASG